jgi:hypothetical protein
MQTSLFEINRAKKLPFVSDIVPTANAEQYQVWLRYDFANMMPTGKNYLLIDVINFTAEQVINAWDRVVVDYYQRQTEKARKLSELARQVLNK